MITTRMRGRMPHVEDRHDGRVYVWSDRGNWEGAVPPGHTPTTPPKDCMTFKQVAMQYRDYSCEMVYTYAYNAEAKARRQLAMSMGVLKVICLVVVALMLVTK